MDPINPIRAITYWFSSQPREIKQDLAFLVLSGLPGADIEGVMQGQLEPIAYFEAWLKQQSQLSSSMKLVGAVLCARVSINFFVMRTRGSEKSWQQTIALSKSLREQFASQGQPVDFIDNMLQQAPFRKRLWIKSAASWRALCAGPLSDVALNDWLLVQNKKIIESKRPE